MLEGVFSLVNNKGFPLSSWLYVSIVCLRLKWEFKNKDELILGFSSVALSKPNIPLHWASAEATEAPVCPPSPQCQYHSQWCYSSLVRFSQKGSDPLSRNLGLKWQYVAIPGAKHKSQACFTSHYLEPWDTVKSSRGHAKHLVPPDCLPSTRGLCLSCCHQGSAPPVVWQTNINKPFISMI